MTEEQWSVGPFDPATYRFPRRGEVEAVRVEPRKRKPNRQERRAAERRAKRDA